ncbi:MAG TPA: hypothetical protein VN918_05225 [Myxococcaceae bacterium]|nr:hypothetical protein [Myxococcaceae bacterium]
MPVQTIRTKKPLQSGSAESLVEEVRKRTGKRGKEPDRVLVVFDDAMANIYYEGDGPAPQTPTPQTPTKRRKARGSSAA